MNLMENQIHGQQREITVDRIIIICLAIGIIALVWTSYNQANALTDITKDCYSSTNLKLQSN